MKWIKESKLSAQKASSSKTLLEFFHNWSDMIMHLSNISATSERLLDFGLSLPSEEIQRLSDGLQLQTQKIILRNASDTIRQINSLSDSEAEEASFIYEKFRRDVDCPLTQGVYHCEYSEETHTIAKNAIKQVFDAVEKRKASVKESAKVLESAGKLGIDVDKIIRDELNWQREQLGLQTIEYELYRIDTMDGHSFEQWCADLLKKNGFTDVEVTKGSGDQGVDVIAVKDSIRYAIQCKCYSSDLGNKPIQEVYAGKAMYQCQIGVVMTNRHFTPGAKELAEATAVLLWDRDKLGEMLGAGV